MEEYEERWGALTEEEKFTAMKIGCKACEELGRAKGMLGSVLCDTCENGVCSICKTHGWDEETGEEAEEEEYCEASFWNGDPVCAFCQMHQCYRCGLFYDGIWEITTYHGKVICEDCGGSHNWCNQCGDYEGGCDYRCPSCDAVCDAECECDIECTECGEIFLYSGYDVRDRNDYSNLETSKTICNDCWNASKGEDAPEETDTRRDPCPRTESASAS